MEGKLRKELPLGLSDFREIISKNCVYVDKTRYAYEIISTPRKYFFLARPRRFGKTVFVSTLESIFKGEKELFEGLFIENKWDWHEWPVIRLSMNSFTCDSYERFCKNLMRYMTKVAEDLRISDKVAFDEDTPEAYLDDMIRALYRKTGKQVVVLVDEYDYPISGSSAASDEDKEKIRNYLGNIYLVLKTDEEFIRFSFITGVIRYTSLSIFSKLNNLEDISDKEEMAGICGYTEEEVAAYFTPYIDDYLNKYPDIRKDDFIEKIKHSYDGYRFSFASDIRVYNPVSLGSFLTNNCIFLNYWWKTGSMSFIKNLVEKRIDCFLDTPTIMISSTDSAIYEVENLENSKTPRSHVFACLLQTGYLTILSVEKNGMLVLGYPNEEVADSMMSFIISSRFRTEEATPEVINSLRKALGEEDIETFIMDFKSIYSSLPHQTNRKPTEGYFHAIMLNTLQLMKIDARSEESIASGTVDMTVRIDDRIIYIFEFKLGTSKDKAEEQLLRKEYYSAFIGKYPKVHIVAISFDKEKRNISDWRDTLLC